VKAHWTSNHGISQLCSRVNS